MSHSRVFDHVPPFGGEAPDHVLRAVDAQRAEAEMRRARGHYTPRTSLQVTV